MKKQAYNYSKLQAERDNESKQYSEELTGLFPSESEVPEKFRLNSNLDQYRILINGQITPWKGALTEVFSPIYIRKENSLVRKRIGSYPEMTHLAASRALDSASRAFSSGKGKWPLLPVSKRIESIETFLERLENQKENILRTLIWEIAKPYHELEDELERTRQYIEQVIKVACQKEKDSLRPRREKGIIGLIHDEPYGIALCLGPYNYPLFETFSLVLPALLAGNVVIIKPPKFGVLFFDFLLEAFQDCFPPGVVNIISGDGKKIIEPLMKSGKVDILAFIGSPQTANRLISLHPRKNRLHCLLGLGAKNAAIVLPDADLDVVVPESVLGALAFNGQRCAALKIFFVHQEIEQAFRERLLEAVSKTPLGMPWMEKVRITPMADPERIPYLHELVRDALNKGARIGNKNGGKSFESIFVPTVLYQLNSKMRIYWEEQFGPVIPVVSYHDLKEPVAYLSSSPFGQQLSIFGTKTQKLMELINLVKNQVSRVNINTKCQRGPDLFPFTGKKDSAHGDFSTLNILDHFSSRAVVAARENELSELLFRRLRKPKNQE
ncbi:MAG TPA: aldehyde dehydrogenase family protein [Candidatus Saccharicenans sp.]|nr:aldehyde dehydrogenase family protein [Candidatus Saccharicenans sp.]HQO76628.1 aldehyde dehydrogenase family protein [Candidatus Saccharicenans sp.]